MVLPDSMPVGVPDNIPVDVPDNMPVCDPDIILRPFVGGTGVPWTRTWLQLTKVRIMR